ncbi:MAG: UDP-glucose 4-epimerase GalE [Propionibacteriaceae bacterium]|jgi:UDP-glucose 4-epimerase|nr:UDP-glucose 4-epimerase GalE [Propionibacteriaceae bacterium]
MTAFSEVLVTGGAGFIGSTIASACSDAGLRPVILDDLSTGLRSFGERFAFYEGDYGDAALLRRVFAEHPGIGAVAHCAASIVVPESVAEPLKYYRNNVAKVVTLAEELLRADCRRVLFSSTAAMYAPSETLVVDEQAPLAPGSPYAASKQMVERILADTAKASSLKVIALRYFNPVGADPSLRTGLQLPNPTHVLGMLLRAKQQRQPFTVTGTDWPTRDGSGLRDYVHVWDLALAHVAALERFDEVMAGPTLGPGYDVVNLGTGRGTTVFELVEAFRKAACPDLEVRTAGPRPGDVAGACASADKAARVLGWRATRTLEQGIADAEAWSRKMNG